MEKLLKNVHTIKGKYAECFIRGPRGFAIGRLILDPFSQLLYTTDANEFTKIRNLQEEGLELAQALEKLSEE